MVTTDKIDLAEARQILDRDHHDLEKVKRRIIEYLAVRKLKPDGGGAILCFVGPPGVGKTSLGKSIAEAMGRKFIRVALGGVRDEADIRGHRRTYIGSMPGRIIAELRKAGTRNPVMMLDEIDKLGADFRGDPSAALLEVLDPAQNHTFTDHYLDVPFDLSRGAVHRHGQHDGHRAGAAARPHGSDRNPRLHQQRQAATSPGDIWCRDNWKPTACRRKQAKFQDAALKWIIEGYTREAGVRNLERQIGQRRRGRSRRISSAARPKKRPSHARSVSKVLGPRRFDPELASRTSVPGVATGMAYTPVGGEILFIEATRMPGQGDRSR